MTEKPKLHVVSFSGGKDSTAMLLRLVEENYPIDIILFCDTGLEFPEMLEHITKVENYIGHPITRIKAEKDFMYWATEHTRKIRSNNIPGILPGDIVSGYGWPSLWSRWCTKELKTNVIANYFRELKKDYQIIEYVGIAYDELKRKRDLNYPLIEWKMTEADCLKYCYDRGFDFGGLYEIWGRVSCWCCPLQSLDDLRKLRKYRPEMWDRLLDMDDQMPENSSTFLKNGTVADINRRFEVEDEFTAQGKKLRTKEFFNELKRRNIKY